MTGPAPYAKVCILGKRHEKTMKKSEFIKAVKDSAEVAEYNRFIDSQTGRKPVGFTKRQAADLKAGYADGIVQGALIGARALGLELTEG